MNAKSIENDIFIRGTGKDHECLLQFLYTRKSYALCYTCLMFGNKRENEMQKSGVAILCCLATVSEKNITTSTKYDKYP